MSLLAKIIIRLERSSFIKNLLLIMTGTALAQIIGFALTPIISRLFLPADFGVYGSFSAVTGVVAAGITLEYGQAIMLPKEKEDAINLLGVGFICTFTVTFIFLLLCFTVPSSINSLMKTEGIWALAFLVIAIMVSGTNQLFQAWAVRAKAFKHTSASQVVRSVSSNSSKIGFGFLKVGPPGLIVSSILGNVMASITLLQAILPDLKLFRSRVQWSRMKKLAKEYRDFPMYSASQNVTNALSNGLPVLLLTHFYGISAAGAYAFGISILQVPMTFILTALRQVLFQKACETQHQGGSISALYIRTTAGLFSIALLPSLILLLWAPQFFSWIFGANWHLAGELARSLVIWLAFAFCNVPAVLFARVIRIQRFVFFYDLVLLGARSSMLVIGGLYFNIHQTVMLFAIVGAVMNAYLIFHVGRTVMKRECSISFNEMRNSC